MSGPLRVPVATLTDGEVVLDDSTSRYVGRVHRKRSGDRLLLFDPASRMEAEATVLDVGRRVRILVGRPRVTTAIGDLDVTLLQALGKGDKVDQVVRDATALGVSRMIVVLTHRCVAAVGNRAAGRRERWRAVAVQAARQCGRGDLPELLGPWTLGEALDQWARPPCLGILLDSRGASLVRALSSWGPDSRLGVAVGPEGGFAGDELELLEKRGFAAVRLGRFTLRTETAATAALGAIAALGEIRGHHQLPRR
ncbi:MAG: 16S rRNA (uracil(1498)-N(3))-methyltransferase [Polyangiaceae bacterium]|nr:16S rRNA (uracil(1498)-N(3))-methyltransferase [Polyangiaceae bacterium]